MNRARNWFSVGTPVPFQLLRRLLLLVPWLLLLEGVVLGVVLARTDRATPAGDSRYCSILRATAPALTPAPLE